jgi:hypothetical protein
MSWFQFSRCSRCLQCLQCSQCSQWFHTFIQWVKSTFIYEDLEENIEPIQPILYNMKTYSHPTSPTKRSSHATENIDEFNIV